jgi:hypothetical protein
VRELVSVRKILAEKWKISCQFSVREMEVSVRDICAEQGEACARKLYWKKEARARELGLRRS